MSALAPLHFVKIYQKPYTDEEFEAKAQLIKHVSDLADGYQQWDVRFPKEKETYTRTVHPRHLID